IPPNCQPPNAHCVSREPILGAGSSQVKLEAKIWRTSKSDKPRVVRWSKKRGLSSPLGKASSATVAESVSMLFPHVYAPRTWTPWLTRSEEHTSELQSRFDLVC